MKNIDKVFNESRLSAHSRTEQNQIGIQQINDKSRLHLNYWYIEFAQSTQNFFSAQLKPSQSVLSVITPGKGGKNI